jgi:hypothetical protein
MRIGLLASDGGGEAQESDIQFSVMVKPQGE